MLITQFSRIKPRVKYGSLLRAKSTHSISPIDRQYLTRSSLVSIIDHYSKKNLPFCTLDDLVNKKSLLGNADLVVHDLLILISKRLVDFRRLPYLLVLNPHVNEIYLSYLQTFHQVLSFIDSKSHSLPWKELNKSTLSFVQDEKDNNRLCEVLSAIMNLHNDNLEVLSKGFAEVKELVPSDVFGEEAPFLDSHLKERILMRLLISSHLELTKQYYRPEKGKFGLIDFNLNVVNVIKRSYEFVNDMCGLKYDETVPLKIETIILKGKAVDAESVTPNPNDTTHSQSVEARDDGVLNFPYIGNHLEYICSEVLKNSARAHIENKVKEPIVVTLVLNQNEGSLEIRFRDKGKGIPKQLLPHIFQYCFTTFEGGELGDSYKTLNNLGGENNVAGMGYGLPLSKSYVEMFNGDMSIQSYENWGTDVYINIKAPTKMTKAQQISL